MNFDLDDTIVAIASAPGGAMSGIIRVSGPETISMLGKCFRADAPELRDLANVKTATTLSGALQLESTSSTLPGQLYLWPNTQSYTRQISAEFHTIGSPPLLESALESFHRSGARLAEPGEFTMRAFLAGRMDLTQAEAVLGVIDANSSTELDVALTQLSGGLATPLNQLRSRLLDLLSHLEAGLDFVEEDIEFISVEELTSSIEESADLINQIVEQISSRNASDVRPKVVLVGRPNAGKSSLLNAILGKSSVIVSKVAGTTRDYVSHKLSLAGVECTITDTAGIDVEIGEHPIDRQAQVFSRRQMDEADVVVLCLSPDQSCNLGETDLIDHADERQLIVLTKMDLVSKSDELKHDGLLTSSKTGYGLDELKAELGQRLVSSLRSDSQVVSATVSRCSESLREASSGLQQALGFARREAGEEIVAAELRHVLESLGRVVGTVYTDDILDRIFSRFCIGK